MEPLRSNPLMNKIEFCIFAVVALTLLVVANIGITLYSARNLSDRIDANKESCRWGEAQLIDFVTHRTDLFGCKCKAPPGHP